jgi:pimeloyl-ACP methyl ester carboxylesterase
LKQRGINSFFEQAMLSTTSQLVIAEQSSHVIHLDRPDVIVAVVEAHIDQLTHSALSVVSPTL